MDDSMFCQDAGHWLRRAGQPGEENSLGILWTELAWKTHGHRLKAHISSEHPNPHQNRLKWVVHLPQNGTIAFDPQPDPSLGGMLGFGGIRPGIGAPPWPQIQCEGFIAEFPAPA